MSTKQFSIGEIFDAIETALLDYQKETESAYEAFSQERERAKREAAAYKDEKARFASLIADAKQTASAACAAADKRLSDKVNGV